MPDEHSVLEVWQKCLSARADAAVWGEFLHRVQPLLLRIAWRVGSEWGVRTRDEIDDLCQDMCLKISQQARSPSAQNQLGEDAFLAYLKASAANAARDSLRARFAVKRGVRTTLPLDDRLGELIGQLGMAPVEQGVLIQQIERYLEDRPARDRAAFWLHFRQGLTFNEIATIPAFGLTAKGVESLIYRMIAALRQHFVPDRDDCRTDME